MDEVIKEIEITSGGITISHFNGVSEVGGVLNAPALNGKWLVKIKGINTTTGYDYFEVINKSLLNNKGDFKGSWKLHDNKIAIPNNAVVICDSKERGGSLDESWSWGAHERIQVPNLADYAMTGCNSIIWFDAKWNPYYTTPRGFVLSGFMPSEEKHDLYVGMDGGIIVAAKIFF